MTIRRILATAALFAATATAALAGPVTIGSIALDDSVLGAGSSFSVSKSFTVGSGGNYVFKFDAASSAENNILIQSVSLLGSGGSYLFGIGSANPLPTAVASHSSEEIFPGFVIDTWTDSYSFSPLFFAAGDWTLQINGALADNKILDGVLSASLVNAVPEPESLALVVGALAALALVSRRQRAAR